MSGAAGRTACQLGSLGSPCLLPPLPPPDLQAGTYQPFYPPPPPPACPPLLPVLLGHPLLSPLALP